MEKPIETGTRKVNEGWFQTSDTKLAAFLWTVGCKPTTPPLRKAYKARKPDEKRIIWRFHLDHSNFGMSLDKCVGIWKKGLPYIADNPECPVGRVMGTIKNYAFLVDLVDRDTPENTIVHYDVNGQKISCLEGSKKHQKLKERLGY